MKTYTVILLWPDYVASSFGQETYMTSVDAVDPECAVVTAQEEAMDSDDNINDKDDLFVIAVIEGEHNDVKP